jgi:hypothetical protein
MRLRITALMLMGLSITACKKDLDTQLPSVSIIAPGSNATLQIPVSFVVKANVSDETRLEWISVQVVTPGGQSKASSSIPVTGNSTTGQTVITVDDPYIETGTYYVRVTAFDGTNEKSSSVPITLLQTPLSTEEVYVLTKNGSQTKFSSLTGTSFTDFFTIPCDRKMSAINPRNKHLAIVPNSGDARVFELLFGNQHYDLSEFNSFVVPYFQFLNYDRNSGLLWVGMANGKTFGIQSNGQTVYNLQAATNRVARAISAEDNFVFQYEYNPIASTHHFSYYYKTSGLLKYSQPLGYAVSQVFETGNNEVLLFAESGGNTHVLHFDRIQEIVDADIDLGSMDLQKVISVDDDLFILAHSNGIHLYQYSTNTLGQIINGIQVYDMDFDPVNNKIYIPQGNTLKCYQYPTGNFIQDFAASDSIYAVHLLFNR